MNRRGFLRSFSQAAVGVALLPVLARAKPVLPLAPDPIVRRYASNAWLCQAFAADRELYFVRRFLQGGNDAVIRRLTELE